MAPSLLNELDIWALRWKLAEIYETKLVEQRRYYVDDIVCTHTGGDNRTCSKYVCAYGYLTRNDKSILKSAFEAFIFLSKLKELCPDHSAIEDFARAVPGKEREERKKPAQNYGAAQVVPLRRYRTDTVATESNNENAEYSILNESEDLYSVRGTDSAPDNKGKADTEQAKAKGNWCTRVFSTIR